MTVTMNIIKNNKFLKKKSKRKLNIINSRYNTTIGRFTRDVENFHGRLAMIGIIGSTFGEEVYNTPIVKQIVIETGIPSIDIFAFIVVTTVLFILQTINPSTTSHIEKELDVFSNPGFTLETEILHGRMAMLAFTYSVLVEQLFSKLTLYYDLSTWYI